MGNIHQFPLSEEIQIHICKCFPKGNKQGLECLHFLEGGKFHLPVWNSSSFFIKPAIVDIRLKYAALVCPQNTTILLNCKLVVNLRAHSLTAQMAFCVFSSLLAYR